jgi:photosystem II stability/assembly factor-like uncharacterized protein
MPPQPKVKDNAALTVAITEVKGGRYVKVSISGALYAKLGDPVSVDVSENKAEKAIMITPRADAGGFALAVYGQNLKKQTGPARRTLRIVAWPNMGARCKPFEANHEVVDWKGGKCLVVRLPYGLFPKTGLGARA